MFIIKVYDIALQKSTVPLDEYPVVIWKLNPACGRQLDLIIMKISYKQTDLFPALTDLNASLTISEHSKLTRIKNQVVVSINDKPSALLNFQFSDDVSADVAPVEDVVFLDTQIYFSIKGGEDMPADVSIMFNGIQVIFQMML